jgi:hypothetical protein
MATITACLAKRKGYNFVFWFSAGSHFQGLITILLLPNTKLPDFSDEKSKNLVQREILLV